MSPRPATILGVIALATLAAAIVFVAPAPPAPTTPAESKNEPTDPPAPASPLGGDAEDGRSESEAAVDAALRFVQAPQEWLFLSPAELDETLGEQLVPGTEPLGDRLRTEAAEARRGLEDTSGTVWFAIAPLAWRVESSSPTSAVVSVWAVTVLSAPGVAASQADWSTTRITLDKVGGRWRLAGFEDAPGPTPQPGATDVPWTPQRMDEALEGFTRVGVS